MVKFNLEKGPQYLDGTYRYKSKYLLLCLGWYSIHLVAFPVIVVLVEILCSQVATYNMLHKCIICFALYRFCS
jgi:hypothetical protein